MMKGSTVVCPLQDRYARRALTVLSGALLALVLTSCGMRQHAVASATPLSSDEAEELFTFQCVTAEVGAQAREAFRPGQSNYERAAALYEDTRQPFNGLVTELAAHVEDGGELDMDSFWAQMDVARAQQEELVTFMEESTFGFGGLETVLALARPYAQRMVRDFVRSYAADQVRQQLLLPPFAAVEGQCTEEE